MIKAVLFDVDGVLYDSMPNHTKSWQTAFGLIGLRLPAKEVYLQEGRTDREFVKIVTSKYGIKKIPQAKIDELADCKVQAFDRLSKPPTIKGAKQFLRQLRRQGFKIGLVTGSSQPQTLQRLKKDFGIGRSQIVIGTEVGRGKPHPEPFLKAAKKLKVRPAECLVIENAPLGIVSAKRAGMKCLAFNSSLLPDSVLRKAGVSKVYKNYRQLMKLTAS